MKKIYLNKENYQRNRHLKAYAQCLKSKIENGRILAMDTYGIKPKYEHLNKEVNLEVLPNGSWYITWPVFDELQSKPDPTW